MALTKILYLDKIETAYNEYVYEVISKRKYRSNKDQFMDNIKLSLLYILTEIMLAYYRDTVTSDENFFTEDEIKEIINMFNDIAVSANISYQEF